MYPPHHWGTCLPVSSPAFLGKCYKVNVRVADPTQSSDSNGRDKTSTLQNQLRFSEVLQWNAVSQNTTRLFARPRRHLAVSVLRRTLLISPHDSSWLVHRHLDTSASPSWKGEQRTVKCRNWQVDARSVLAPGQPCGTQDDSCSITRVSALCSPAFQFPGRFISSSTGLYERSEPVWADQPSHDLKHWGACARNQASRTRDNSE